ncbi:MAG TPA: sulfotransferase [Rhodopila sp.]|nr:sulfotransferase [Rhodopila sp.]
MTPLAQAPLAPTALAAPILVLGAPRSGTTWLAKIVDSHPGVVYRHEPDKAHPPPVPLTEAAVPALVARWAASRTPSVVTKRPFFAKSWQPAWLRLSHTALVGALDIAARLPMLPLPAQVPDLATAPAERVLFKSIALRHGAGALGRALPDSRIVFVLRHPCGQVSSVMRGNRQRRFDLQTEGTDMPFDEAAAMAHAATFGVASDAFQALPDAAKYAWGWRHFNETAYADLASLPNVHILPYEALCADPVTVARAVMTFTGLGWVPETADFVSRSTAHTGDAGYYAVYRNAIAAAEAWRRRMDKADIEAVRRVASGSPLARFWPDLVETAVA